MAARRGAISGGDLAEDLEDMLPQKQLDMLYSAVIDDDQQKITQIREAGKKAVFTKEAVTKVCEAATKVAATQKSPKQIRIENAVQATAKEFKVEVSVNQSKSQGR